LLNPQFALSNIKEALKMAIEGVPEEMLAVQVIEVRSRTLEQGPSIE